jgi:hypothetical protein
MPVALKPLLAEFTAHLDRTGLDQRLQAVHQLLVGVGLLGCLGVVWVHAGLPGGAEHASLLARNVLLLVSMLNLTLCAWAIARAQAASLRRLQARSETVEQRARQVAEHIWHRDGLLLALAVGGQAIALLAAALRIRLLSLDAPLVILNLLPTAQLVILGWSEIPSRQRLLYLYKLVALHNERSRQLEERPATRSQ